MSMSPNVIPFFHQDSGTWSYLVRDPASTAAAIIDPVLDFDPRSGRTGSTALQALVDRVVADGLQVHWLLETHAHADHLSAAHALKATSFPAAQVAIGEGIRKVQATFQPIYHLGDQLSADGSQFDRLLTDGERFPIGGLEVQVIATPGHTSDSCAYLVGDALFTGDTLFMPDGGTARCDFPGGSAATLYRSIQRLFALPDATRVFVCHDYGPNGRAVACETSIDAQKHANIHVGNGVPETEYIALREARDATLAMPKLLLLALQVNLRAGALPTPEANGIRYLKLPLNQFD